MFKIFVPGTYRYGIYETLHGVWKDSANLGLKLAARDSAEIEAGFIFAVSVVHQSSTDGAEPTRSHVVQGDGEAGHVILGKPCSEERHL